MEKNPLKRAYITERELVEIYQEQYNDIFPEILQLEQLDFFKILEKQVISYLYIAKKYSPQTLLKKVEKNFAKKYGEEKKVVSNDYELINNTPRVQLDYLNKYNCIIHCPKCKDALHTCGFKFVVYGNYVYCLSCKKVYNEKKVDMYCDACDIDYYTKLREITDYKYESFFLLAIKDYHCEVDTEEKIKCPKCDKDLYANLLNKNNSRKIGEGTCINCNLNFNLNLFNYKCKQCGKYFISEAKIYNDFYNKNNDLISTVHSLVNNKFSAPESLLNKTCDCNLNNVDKYKHNDGGILLDGQRNGQKIIVCDKCYNIFNYYDFVFNCPLCNKQFNSNKANNYKELNSGNNVAKKNNLTVVGRNDTKRRNTCISKDNHSNKDLYHCKGECSSSSSKNKKSKNAINSNCSVHNKLLKSSNQKPNNLLSTKNVSKIFKESDNETISNKENPNTNNKTNEKQNININIQNIYNNYAPIINILENNPKKSDRTNEPKSQNSNSNNRLIHTSPKMKNRNNNNRNIDNNSTKQLINAGSLKRAITENPNNNSLFRNSDKSNTKYENIENKEDKEQKTNEDNEKEVNSKLNSNIWNNNKNKFSASFSVATSNKNTNNGSEYQINSSPMNTQSSTRETKKRYSAESDKIQNMAVTKNDSNNNNKIIDKVNPIKEINEEYSNDNKEIKTKKPKSILKFDTSNVSESIINKTKKLKKVVISSSVSEEKHQKMKKEKDILDDNINNPDKKERPKSKVNSSLNNTLKYKNNILSLGNKSSNISGISDLSLGANISNLSNVNVEKKPRRTQRVINKKQISKNSKKKIIGEFNSDDYNILNMLGEGTFSQIFLVEHSKTGEKFALKKMAATKMEDLEEKKKEFEFILKLTSENDKLNLVKIYGTQMKVLDKFNLVLYVLMEAAISDWETELKNRHYSKDFYTEEQLKNILLNLVQTFADLQKKGICHRDVKPQNILCFGNGVYKITDFGEAKSNKNKIFEKNSKFNFSQDTSVQTIRGTELYMSPILFNALRNSNVEDLQYNAFKSDVFSLGLCFLLSGCLSYRPLSELRDIRENAQIQLLIERALSKRYSKNFIKVICSMLQLEEKDRPDFIELENIIKKNL